MGSGRTYPAGFTLGNSIYIGTGLEETGSLMPTVDFFQYNPATDNWKKEADYKGGNRWLTVGFSIGKKGYFGTGSDLNNNYNDFWEYSADCISFSGTITAFRDTICSGTPAFLNVTGSSEDIIWQSSVYEDKNFDNIGSTGNSSLTDMPTQTSIIV